MAQKFNTLRSLCTRAAADGVVPGCVVLVGRGGETLFHEAFGLRQIVPDPRPAATDVVYDLASLTKPLITSVLVMQGVASGRWDVDDPLHRHLSGFDVGPRRAVTIRHLLAHAAGFPAHRLFYEDAFAAHGGPSAAGRDSVIRAALHEPLVAAPGEHSLYSDVGFIVLGALLEQAHGARLDAIAERSIFGPLGVADLGFSLPAGPVAPTERCPVRRRLMVGEVHDLNAFAMGGVAGHAGLFGTAGGVAALLRALLADFHTGPGRLVDRDVLRTFWRPAGIPGSTWRLGWDGPSPTASLAGDRLSRAAVGHLAFTGCSIWLDPIQAVFVVMLSNRIHPAVRDEPLFRALRPLVNDEALGAIGYRSV